MLSVHARHACVSCVWRACHACAASPAYARDLNFPCAFRPKREGNRNNKNTLLLLDSLVQQQQVCDFRSVSVCMF